MHYGYAHHCWSPPVCMLLYLVPSPQFLALVLATATWHQQQYVHVCAQACLVAGGVLAGPLVQAWGWVWDPWGHLCLLAAVVVPRVAACTMQVSQQATLHAVCAFAARHMITCHHAKLHAFTDTHVLSQPRQRLWPPCHALLPPCDSPVRPLQCITQIAIRHDHSVGVSVSCATSVSFS